MSHVHSPRMLGLCWKHPPRRDVRFATRCSLVSRCSTQSDQPERPTRCPTRDNLRPNSALVGVELTIHTRSGPGPGPGLVTVCVCLRSFSSSLATSAYADFCFAYGTYCVTSRVPWLACATTGGPSIRRAEGGSEDRLGGVGTLRRRVLTSDVACPSSVSADAACRLSGHATSWRSPFLCQEEVLLR